jgi:hypothetical protein
MYSPERYGRTGLLRTVVNGVARRITEGLNEIQINNRQFDVDG